MRLGLRAKPSISERFELEFVGCGVETLTHCGYSKFGQQLKYS